MADSVPPDVPQDVPGTWLGTTAAARRLGVTARAVRERVRRGTLTARTGNRGREVFVPADAVPREVPEEVRTTLPGRYAVRPIGSAGGTAEELTAERAGREAAERRVDELKAALAATDRDLAVSRRELELERERSGELRAERDAMRGEVAELRRPWLARWLDALRRRQD